MFKSWMIFFTVPVESFFLKNKSVLNNSDNSTSCEKTISCSALLKKTRKPDQSILYGGFAVFRQNSLEKTPLSPHEIVPPLCASDSAGVQLRVPQTRIWSQPPSKIVEFVRKFNKHRFDDQLRIHCQEWSTFSATPSFMSRRNSSTF